MLNIRSGSLGSSDKSKGNDPVMTGHWLKECYDSSAFMRKIWMLGADNVHRSTEHSESATDALVYKYPSLWADSGHIVSLVCSHKSRIPWWRIDTDSLPIPVRGQTGLH